MFEKIVKEKGGDCDGSIFQLMSASIYKIFFEFAHQLAGSNSAGTENFSG